VSRDRCPGACRADWIAFLDDDVVPEPGWTSLVPTPNFPEYPSNHSCSTTAIASVIDGLKGHAPFSFSNVSIRCPSKSRITFRITGVHSSGPVRARAIRTGRASASATPGTWRTESTSASLSPFTERTADAGRVFSYIVVSTGWRTAYL